MSNKNIYVASVTKLKGEGKVCLLVSNPSHNYSAPLHCRIALFCAQVNLNPRDVYRAMAEAERHGSYICQVADWVFEWAYLDTFRQEMMSHNIILTDRVKGVDVWVNVDSKRKCDTKLWSTCMEFVNNYMGVK